VYDVAADVLTHRLVVTYDALAAGIEPEQVVARILATVPAPRLTPTQDPSARALPPAPSRSDPRPAPPADGPRLVWSA
jgi:MoxR-like ATPase